MNALIKFCAICALFSVGFFCGWNYGQPKYIFIECNRNIKSEDVLTDWEIMTIAIGINESRLDTLAKNPNSSATGWLQQLKIYVDDCNENRQNYKKYSYDDRNYLQESIEMFNLLQKRYNPKMDITKAIQLHSMGLSEDWDEWAQYSVVQKMLFIERYEKIRSEIIKLREYDN